MHQTRAQVTKKIPIVRKGTKYIAKALTDSQNSVPVVIALRDMLHLAKTSREVKMMIKQKLLKINGKEVKDVRDSIRLFNIFEADKPYILTLTETGSFAFEETKSSERACKVIGKTILKGSILQLNLHDGSNLLTKDKINVHDTVYLGKDNKIKKHVQIEKGKECFVISGKYSGKKGKVESLVDGTVNIKLEDSLRELRKRSVLAL